MHCYQIPTVPYAVDPLPGFVERCSILLSNRRVFFQSSAAIVQKSKTRGRCFLWQRRDELLSLSFHHQRRRSQQHMCKASEQKVFGRYIQGGLLGLFFASQKIFCLYSPNREPLMSDFLFGTNQKRQVNYIYIWDTTLYRRIHQDYQECILEQVNQLLTRPFDQKFLVQLSWAAEPRTRENFSQYQRQILYTLAFKIQQKLYSQVVSCLSLL